jgi:hypothetical protein
MDHERKIKRQEFRIIRRNGPLIDVLKRCLAREEAKIERAQEEIHRIKLELLDLGIELPIHEYLPSVPSND